MASAEPRVVMALKVRDEEDVIHDVLRYHHAQGVDFFVVTDNASTDSTPEILGRWVDAGLARVIVEESPELRERGHEWVTRMAQVAATEHGADWVVHGDADEFWWPLEGTIKDALGAVPPDYGVVYGPRAEFVARSGDEGSYLDRLVYREARSLIRPKIAHRALPDAMVLHRGQHDVTAGADPDDAWQRLRTPGRPVLRSVRPEGPGESEERLVPYPCYPLRIFHLPLRSFEQYRGKVDAMLNDPVSGDEGMRGRLRDAAESSGGLEGLYAGLVTDDAAVEAGIAEGSLVRDERLRDFMRACPDPLAGGGPRPELPAPSPDELAAERAQLELDASHVLARSARMLQIRHDRARDQVARLSRQVKRLKQKAKKKKKPPTLRKRLGALLGRGG
jgi:glycosyl transferase family 2